jgi:hypothetical protein
MPGASRFFLRHPDHRDLRVGKDRARDDAMIDAPLLAI